MNLHAPNVRFKTRPSTTASCMRFLYFFINLKTNEKHKVYLRENNAAPIVVGPAILPKYRGSRLPEEEKWHQREEESDKDTLQDGCRYRRSPRYRTRATIERVNPSFFKFTGMLIVWRR